MFFCLTEVPDPRSCVNFKSCLSLVDTGLVLGDQVLGCQILSRSAPGTAQAGAHMPPRWPQPVHSPCTGTGLACGCCRRWGWDCPSTPVPSAPQEHQATRLLGRPVCPVLRWRPLGEAGELRVAVTSGGGDGAQGSCAGGAPSWAGRVLCARTAWLRPGASLSMQQVRWAAGLLQGHSHHSGPRLAPGPECAACVARGRLLSGSRLSAGPELRPSGREPLRKCPLGEPVVPKPNGAQVRMSSKQPRVRADGLSPGHPTCAGRLRWTVPALATLQPV